MRRCRGWLAVAMLFLLGSARAEGLEDIVNNLLSDLAPLLALCGERVTMQFLSQALGWADCVTLAMAPLGIIAIIVSAIRVGGPIWLKAVVGRARENTSTAEMELMSSTSHEVCELYNGKSLVRCQGSAPIWEYICLSPKGYTGPTSSNDSRVRFVTLKQAVESGILEELEDPVWKISLAKKKTATSVHDVDCDLPTATTSARPPKSLRNRFLRFGRADRRRTPCDNGVVDNSATYDDFSGLTIIHDTGIDSPSISLNLQKRHDRTWIRLMKLRFQRDGKPVASESFPLAASGTVAVVLGMLICGHVIEDSTEEKRYRPTGSFEIGMYWIQREQTVADQAFESFAIKSSSPRSVITMSRRKAPVPQQSTRLLEIKTMAGVSISLVGFVLQPGFTKAFEKARLLPGFELDWLAWKLTERDNGGTRVSPSSSHDSTASTTAIPEGKARASKQRHIGSGSWTVITGCAIEYKPFYELSTEDGLAPMSSSEAQTVLTIRRGLCKLVGFHGRSASIAVNLAMAIEKAMDVLFPPKAGPKVYRWYLGVAHNRADVTGYAKSQVWEQQSEDEAQLLCPVGKKDDSWLRENLPQSSARLFGRTSRQLIQDLDWWTPQGTGAVREVDEMKENGPCPTVKLKALQIAPDIFECIGRPPFTATTVPGEVILQVRGASRDLILHRPRLSPFPKGVECKRVVGYGQSIQPHTSSDIGESIAVQGGSTLAIETRDSLEDLFAKDLLFSFMCSAASTLEQPISSKTELQPTETSFSLNENCYCLWNRDLTDLTETFSQLGFGPRQEASIGIISPLSMAQKLPFPQALFDFVLPEIMGFHRDQAYDMDLWRKLNNRIECYPFGNTGIRECFVALLIEVFNNIGSTFESMDKENRTLIPAPPWELARDRARIKMLRQLRQEIFRCLKSEKGIGQFFGHLTSLYREQYRQMPEDLTLPGVAESTGLEYIPSSFNLTKLHLAAMSTPTSRRALEVFNSDTLSAIPVNKQDICQWTALHYAAAAGNWASVARLQEHLSDFADAIDVTAKDFRGYTALHLACQKYSVWMVRYLLSAGASLESQGYDGVTPVHLVAGNRSPMLGKEILNFFPRLFKIHIPVDCKGRLPIHWAAVDGSDKIINALKRAIKAVDNWGWTPLHLAAVHNRSSIVSKLLKLSAVTDSRDAVGRTALYLACERNHVVILKLLLGAGSSCRIGKDDGSTPLHQAAALQDPFKHNQFSGVSNELRGDYGVGIEVVKLLIAGGADTWALDGSGRTPFDIAEKEGHTEVMGYLRNS
ncbi:hypothetical protein AK830_g8536 [Neonectria ditissima]|uniref:Uncharacterized protein n=1 Tax=Neonectria ditissima TaxID=78410 RepID=A0A0P7BC82_9HYPO|nr:hypothetical protein AK830_g8536 [Neonectria ditissima]